MTVGPTRGASDERTWSANARQAWLVRAAVYLAPVVASFLVTRIASAGFWHPPGWPGLAVYLTQGTVVGLATALLAGRMARRILPLASLLNMTLVFPDRAPPRFGVALRSGTISQLRRLLADGQVDWPEDAQQAAEVLVGLVTELGRHERLTRGHTERVRAYADLIGEELGLGADDRHLLHWGAMVHDIGKLTVPPEILNKQGRPTDAEWAILRGHPAAGGRMLEPLAGWLGDWRLAASQHHERWDGTGYPIGLAGRDISLAGRIVAVADAYDVITSTRSYKKAMAPQAAREEMVRCAGTQFDPDVVRALLAASLTRERTALGFVGWLTQVNGLSAIPRTISQVATTAVTATAVAAGAVGATPLITDQPPQQLALTAPTTSEPPDNPTTTDLATTTAPPATDRPPPSPTELGSTEPLEADGLSEPTETTVAESSSTMPPPIADSTDTTSRPSSTAPSTAPSSSTSPSTATTRAPTTTAAPTTAPGSAVAIDDSVTVENHKNIKIYVVENDQVGGSADLTSLRITVDPAKAQEFRAHDDFLHYKSIKDYLGTDTLQYEACWDNGVCDTATVTITVTAS